MRSKLTWWMRQTLKHALLLSPVGPWLTRKLAGKQLRVLADREDFTCRVEGTDVHTYFTDRSGMGRFWDYEPLIQFDRRKLAWKITVDGAVFYLDELPIYELTNEFRAYTVLGRPKADSIIVDVGGSLGLSSFALGALCPNGKIFLMEPDPHCARAIRRKLELNPKSPVTWIPKGVALRSGNVRFVSEAGGTSHFEFSDGKTGANDKGFVPVLSLRELMKEHGLPRVDFIKMDIEGMETLIVEDVCSLVSENPSCVAVIASYHKQKDGRTSSALLEEFVKMRSDLIAKTIYPLHPTTVILHRKNTAGVSNLEKIPRAQGFGI